MFKICFHNYVPLIIINPDNNIGFDFTTALTNQKCTKCGKIRKHTNSSVAISNEYWNKLNKKQL